MAIFIIFISGIIGTAVMTGFSHVMELITGHKFNEAHLLNGLIDRSNFSTSKIEGNHFLGWVIHFIIGVCMAAALYCYYFYLADNVLIWTGIFLGFILGIIGITGWSMLINVHSNPPKITWKFFFAQLIVAHVIFGASVTWVLLRFIFNT